MKAVEIAFEEKENEVLISPDILERTQGKNSKKRKIIKEMPQRFS